MASSSALPLAVLGLLAAGCSAFWPTVVRDSPDEPLFHSGFPLVGGARLDGALCSLATVGPDATRLVSPPEVVTGAIPLDLACSGEGPLHRAFSRGRPGTLVRIETPSGDVFGYLYRDFAAANGVLVAFSGMGMPASGWVNERFAEVASAKGLLTFALVRDEAVRPIAFDPVREARRGIEAAERVAAACGVPAAGPLAFVGISLGGMEALLATRGALARGLEARGAVLDPLLDPDLAAGNLDSTWHSAAVDSMQAYFRRILAGRYGERPTPSFRTVLERRTAETVAQRDAPSAWLCAAPRKAYAIFLSDTDPVLGNGQREFGHACNFPFRRAAAPGHVPLACNLDLFPQMIEAVSPQSAALPQ
ncbi:MAG TPA: hypothetical protein VI356_17500 [Myxococcales bacterium]